MKKQIKQAQKYLEWEQPKQAIAELRPVLRKNRACPWVAHHLMGVALSQSRSYKSSIKHLENAIEKGSEAPETYHMLSVNCFHLGQFDEAEQYEREALNRNPELLKGWMNLGSIYRAQAKLEDALECYTKANKLDPKNSGVAFRIGEIYRDQGDLEQALKLFDITLQLDEGHKRAILEKAEINKKKGRYEEAEKYIKEAKERHGSQLPILVTEAELYKSKGDYDQAVELYEVLLDQQPGHGIIRVNYALCLQELSQFDESEKNYRRAIKDLPGNQGAISNYLMGLHYNPNNSREHIYKEHVRLVKDFMPKEAPTRPLPSNKSKDKRLKVGFVSGGFRQHPVGWMIAGALEQLPDDVFEIYCYTTNNKFDFVTQRIHKNIDEWRSIVGYDPGVVEGLLRDDELDILVDLSGHAADNCLDVMANEPAPIMVKWVGGLFNTTGLPAFDYLISDWYETPEGEEEFYTEKLVRLPDDYISYTPPSYAPDVNPLPAQKNGYITFGCFNNPTKVNDGLLAQWAKIMNEVPDSRLLLKSNQYDTPSVKEHIRGVLEEQGISGDRVLFKGHSPHDEHLEAYSEVDIALDPWPYSGGLTTCEAIYMGVPVITLPGPTFAGRHSMTHLLNIGLSDWVVDSWDEYTEKVVELATDLPALAEIRKSLRDKISNSPVCDGKRFGAHLAVAFREMWKQWLSGQDENIEEWQDHIAVDELTDEQLSQWTDGPSVTPLISVDGQDDSDGIDYQEEVETIAPKENGQAAKNTTVPDKIEGVTKEFAKNGTAQKNGRQTQDFCIETKDGVSICVPPTFDLLTTYVLLEQQEWFENELNFVSDFLQPGMTVIDAGAAFGVYALPMAEKVGSKGAVYAFEPGDKARAHLDKSKQVNGYDQLKVIERGLADETGVAKLEQAESPEFNTLDKTGEGISVTTLDAWWDFEGRPKVDLLKVDVNGMETELLEGADTMLSETSPVVIISVGENENTLSAINQKFESEGYKLYEYIPSPGVLVDFEPEAGIDPYVMNLVAVKENREEELANGGLIFNADIEIETAEQVTWEELLCGMKWADEQVADWKVNTTVGEHSKYVKALNLICTAEQLEELETSSRSLKAKMLLTAAKQLITIFNNGKAGIATALTYVRLMNGLGKRHQAVEMIKELMQTLNSGNEITVELPFLPPLPQQDSTSIQTDFAKWLTVRIVEAWAVLKDPTTFMSGGNKMLSVLEGNPEVTEWFSCRLDLLALKKGDALTNNQKERFKNSFGINVEVLLDNVTKQSDETDSLVVKEQQPRDNKDNQGKLIPEEFWQAPLSNKKGKWAIDIAAQIDGGEFARHIDAIVEECQAKIDQDGTNSMAFFLMVKALLASDSDLSEPIDEALRAHLEKRSWEHKKALYAYFYDSVEINSKVISPELSVIVVSNNGNDEVIKNLEEIDRQSDKQTEVIFVNNGLEKEKAAAIADYVDLVIHLKQNAGACMARNFGALFSKGDLFMFVDDDGIPEEGMLQAHKDIHADHDLYVARGVYQPKTKGSEIPCHYYLGPDAKSAVCFLEGNTSFSPAAFFDVGGWNDSLLVYHEGMELSYRYAQKGYEKEKLIYFPDAVLRHDYIKSPKSQDRKGKLLSVSKKLIDGMYPNIDSVIHNWPEVSMETYDSKLKKEDKPKYRNLEKVIYLAPGNSDMAYGLHNKRASMLAGETRKEGISADILYLTDQDFLKRIVEVSEKDGYAVHAGTMGYPSWVEIDRVQSANLFDLLDIKVFATLGDHLFADFMWQRLKKMGSKTIFYAQEQSMLNELEVLGPGGNESFLMDYFPAITEIDEKKAGMRMEDREIDILVPWSLNGNYANTQMVKQALSKIGGNFALVGKLLLKKMKGVYDVSVLSVFQECYEEVVGSKHSFKKGKTQADYQWMKVLHTVDQHVRHWRRFEILKQLAGLPNQYSICITADQDQVKGYKKIYNNKNITWQGRVTTQHLDRLYSISKVVLNSNPTYPDYLHGRVKNSMKWGCCLITDQIPGLSKRFNHGEHLLFLDDKTDLATLIKENSKALQDIADQGKKIMDSTYTMDDFSKALLKEMDQRI
ncbi:FkbM family methyltransferase [Fodinibius saliphilus]|uniref:FkbM family methyltransferase n=1 Tax=Fodinibius saliphilus TaxID=1920650 RepID=UPI001108152F|nr:FkbM family methyltransferase [Fodinibius saliphilus]